MSDRACSAARDSCTGLHPAAALSAPRFPRRVGHISVLSACALVCSLFTAPVSPEPAPRLHALAAQVSDSWPPVDPADLALKDNPQSLGSHAMILEREVVIDDPGRSASEYVRIKIFDEEGKDYGNIEIPFQDSIQEVTEIQARTVKPDGSIVSFQGQVFDQDVVKYKKLKYRAKVFTLPEVQAGSVIEYKYKFRWSKDPDDQIKNPGKYNFALGFVYSYRAAVWIVQSDLYLRHGHFVFRPFRTAHLQVCARVRTDGEIPEEKPDGSYQMDVKDFPAFREETLMPPEDALRGRVDFFYLTGNVGSDEWFWSQAASQFAQRQAVFLSKHKLVDRVAAQTVAAGDSPEVKLKKLYERAQQVRFISFEHSRSGKELKQEHLAENKNVDDILDHGYAFSNEVNILFAALARSAGFRAGIALVSSRNSTLFVPTLFDLSQLNANLVWVQKGTGAAYFDPATYLCPFGLLPWEETATRGVRVGGSSSGIITVPQPQSKDAVVERKARLHLGTDGALAGKFELIFHGQFALQWKLSGRNEDAAGRRKDLQDAVKAWLPPGSKVDLLSSSGWDSPDDPLRAEFDLSIPDQALKTTRRLLIPVAVTITGESSPFPHASRTNPVYFHFPYEESDEIRFELPDGYELEALPRPHKLAGPRASYELTSTRDGREMVTKRSLVMDGFFYEVRFYPGLRSFFSGVHTDDKDRAVLKLASTRPPQ